MTDADKTIERCLREIMTVLSKYDAEIGGCGCCGSGWLMIGSAEASKIEVNGTGAKFFEDDAWQKVELT